MTASVGTDRIRTMASVSVLDQGGNIVNYNFNRYNGRFNTDFNISDKLDVNFDISFNRSKRVSPAKALLILYRTITVYLLYTMQFILTDHGGRMAGPEPIAAARAGGLTTNLWNYFRGVLKINYKPIKD
jgi:hypothetical protein